MGKRAGAMKKAAAMKKSAMKGGAMKAAMKKAKKVSSVMKAMKGRAMRKAMKKAKARAEEPGRFQEAFAHQMPACRCGYSAGHGWSCCEAGGLMVAWSSLCIVLLVRLVAHLH